MNGCRSCLRKLSGGPSVLEDSDATGGGGPTGALSSMTGVEMKLK
jgi:hypothetical protein